MKLTHILSNFFLNHIVSETAKTFGKSHITYLRYQEELKKVPLKNIQSAYFEFLEDYFGKPFSEMKRHELAPPDVARDIASRDNMVRAFVSSGEAFFAGLHQFWDTYEPVVHAHLEDLHCLKSIYGGDISPSYTANIACSAGLYVDTIILPDPLLRVEMLFRQMKPEQFVYYLAKHALNILNYKELALADVTPPIVVVAPDTSALDNELLNYLHATSQADILVHSSKLFGHTFASDEELNAFLTQFFTPQELVAHLADPARLLFDSEWSGPPEQQILRYLNETGGQFNDQLFGGKIGGRIVQLMLTGRMVQINDLLFKSARYGGAPLVDAPTSWQYLLWKYEYDREHAQELDPTMKDVFVTQALQAGESPELQLISGLQPQDLLTLRQQGALSELREMLFHGIGEIEAASPSALTEVTQMVSANIGAAFSKHKKDLETLSSGRKRFFGLNVAPFIGAGAITLAAASTGNVPLTIAAGMIGLSGAAPTGKDLWKQGKALIETGKALKRSPTGILFRHKK